MQAMSWHRQTFLLPPHYALIALGSLLDTIYLLEREEDILSAAISIVHWLIERGEMVCSRNRGMRATKSTTVWRALPIKNRSEHLQGGVEDVVEKAQLAVAAALRPGYQSSRWGRILLVVTSYSSRSLHFLPGGYLTTPYYRSIFITQQFQENPAPWLRYTMVAVSFIGDVVPLFVGLIALVSTPFWIVDLRLEAVMVVALSATSAILNALIKYIVGRPRPAPEGRRHAQYKWFEFSQRPCHVLYSIVGVDLLVHPYPL